MSDPVEEALLASLAAASEPAQKARAHAALAIHYGARCMYRAMNHHEKASATAFSRAPGGEALAIALATEECAITAFGNLDDDTGKRLLGESVPIIRAALGPLHPFARQATETFLGRMDLDAQERHALRAELLASAEALYGPSHINTLRCAADVARFRSIMGDLDAAILLFERAFDGFMTPRPELEGDVGGSLARRCAPDVAKELVTLYSQRGAAEAILRIEDRLLAAGDALEEAGMRLRLQRLPEQAWAYNVSLVEHAVLVLGRHEPLVAEAIAVTREAADALLARIDDEASTVPDDSPRDSLLFAASELVRLRVILDGGGPPEDCDIIGAAVWAKIALFDFTSERT